MQVAVGGEKFFTLSLRTVKSASSSTINLEDFEKLRTLFEADLIRIPSVKKDGEPLRCLLVSLK